MIDELIALLSQLFEGVPPWQATLLLIGVSLGIAVALELVVMRSLLRYTSRTRTDYDYILVGSLRPAIVLTVGLAGVYLLTQLESVTESVVLTTAQLDTFFGYPALSIIIVAWAHASNRLVNRVVEEVKNEGPRFEFAPVISNVWTILVTVGALAALLRLWGYNITPLLGAAGVAGVAIGFAAQDTVANFFGGIALYFDDTYKLGDFIVLDSGESGTVVNVGIRSTTLRTRDEVLVTVPNAELNSAKVINQSGPQRRTRLKVPVGVAYGTDIDAFEDLVVDIAEAEPLVLDSPKPRMRFRSFGDSALEYELVCWANTPTRVNRVKHELNRTMYKELLAADVEIPFPQRDVTVTTAHGSVEEKQATTVSFDGSEAE